MRLALLIIFVSLLAKCGGAPNANQSAGSNVPSTEKQTLKVVDQPQKIKDLRAARGQQESASPTIKIVEPRANATVSSSTVKVKLELSGDLKGYAPHMDEATKTGNHIHVILDNQPYEAYYNIDGAFELRNVADGEHTLRVFPSRPWHESYKNPGAFQMVKFTVKNGGADTNKPTTTNSGNTMANANTAPTPEGKDMQNSTAGTVDPKKPLLTYSRPKGEYKDADADAIMIDFWIQNARFMNEPNNVGRASDEYYALPVVRIKYSIDGGEPQFIDDWHPIWLSGWTPGKHTIKLELVDMNGNVIDNGGYNSTTREITVIR